MTDQAIRNLNLTLHLMKKNIFFSFLLKIHDRVMSLCLPQDYLPKMTTPWENSRICVPSNLSWGGGGGNCSFYSRFKQELDPLKLDDFHRFFRSHLRRRKNFQNEIFYSQAPDVLYFSHNKNILRLPNNTRV